MRKILFATGVVALAALTAGCGTYYDRSYAYAPARSGYYGDRYYNAYAYRNDAYRTYPSTAYAYPSNAYPSTTGYYYSRGDYYRNYRGIHSPPERTM